MSNARPLDVRPGDAVLIRATVVQHHPGVGTLVELFSKTDQYQAWVREDKVAQVVLPTAPPEPADQTMLLGEHDGNLRVFRRDDGEGHNDPDRRYHRRWWDVTAEEWIDWPEAVRRGADNSRRMVLAGDSE